MSSQRIRILHVVHCLEPGGMENGLVNVARRLPSEEFEVHVCCLWGAGLFAGRLPNPANVYPLNKNDGLSLAAICKLAKIIWRVRPHLIHTHNMGPLLYSVAATLFGMWCPILHGEHGQLTGEELTERLLRARRRVYWCCRRVHTVSQSLRDHLVSLGFPADKIVVVVNGVDADRFQPAARDKARASIGLSAEGPILGIVGRFTPFKGHGDLIRAFERLAGSRPQARLLIVGGGGSEEDRIRAQVQASPAAGQIVLTGFQSQPERYYQAMDLLVVPSVHEGLSNAVLEAMACGVPVLTHTACGNAEVVRHGENGWMADLGTVDSLVAEIEKRLAHPEQLADAGRRAREIVSREFSISKMAGDYAQLYRKLARGPFAADQALKYR